jgi:hypothetical protein
MNLLNTDNSNNGKLGGFMKKDIMKYKVILFKPNTKLYVILTIFFGLVVTISFISLCTNLDNAYICTILSAIISVFGGILASIIVAWLIDVSTCNRNNTSLTLREKQCFDYLVMSIDDLFQAFADSQSNFESMEPARWEVWFRKLALQNFNKSETDFYERMLIVYVSLNQVIAQVDKLNSGDLKDFIIRYDVTSELIMLSDTCRRVQNLIFNNRMENIDHIVFCMNDVLGTLLAFVELSQKEYVPNIESKQDESDSSLS